MHSILFKSIEDLYRANIWDYDRKVENPMSTNLDTPEKFWEVIYVNYKIA